MRRSIETRGPPPVEARDRRDQTPRLGETPDRSADGRSSTAAAGIDLAAGPPPRWSRPLRRWAALPLSAGLLIWTASRVDLDRVAERLTQARPLWLLAALAALIPAILLPAWRWVFTASRLGLRVEWRRAWREYYVSVLLNQVLPGGVAGDIVRVVRHRRALGPAVDEDGARAVKAVVLERASNQLVLWALLAVALIAWSDRPAASALRGLGAALSVALTATLVWIGIKRWALGRPWAQALARAQADAHRALVADGALLIHIAVSGSAILSLGITYACASAAIGAPLDVRTALRIVPLVLGAGAVPAVFAGWGLREASAATFYALAGLSAADGAAASVMYGLLSLLASAPGIWFLVTDASGPSRRAF